MNIHQRIDKHLNAQKEYIYLADDAMVLYYWTSKPGGPECHTPEETGEIVHRKQWISIQGEPWKKRQRGRVFINRQRHLNEQDFREWAFE